MLEDLLYRKSNGQVNIYGVEVPSCVNRHLPEERLLRVPHVRCVVPEAVHAETLMFAYPRHRTLLAEYLDTSVISGGTGTGTGICTQLVVISTHSEYAELADLIAASFHTVEIVASSGLPEYEVLAIASTPIRYRQ